MSRKGENIYKRKDGRWEGRYPKKRNANGRIIYGYVYDKNYKGVKMKLENAKGIVGFAEMGADTPRYTLAQIAERWFAYIRPKVKHTTYIKYVNIWKLHIKSELGKKELCELNCFAIEEYSSYLLRHGGKKGEGLSEKTVADTLSLLKQILRYGSQRLGARVCDTNCISVSRKQNDICVMDRTSQQTLVSYLYRHPSPRNTGILLCLFTGMRIGEICALKSGDIDVENKLIYVHSTMQRIQSQNAAPAKTKIIFTTPKSACSVRAIPIPEDLMPLIEMVLRENTEYFLAYGGKAYVEPRNMQNYFQAVLKICELPPLNFHALRHTFATRCIEVGFDVKSLSEILGHANVNITLNRYVHPSVELKRANMELLKELLAVK